MPSFTPGEAVTHPAAHQPGHPHTAVPTAAAPQIRANPWRPSCPGPPPDRAIGAKRMTPRAPKVRQ